MKTKKRLLIIIFIMWFLLVGFSKKKKLEDSNKLNIFNGKKLSGDIAELFAPKKISPKNKRHSKISVSPDGFNLYWSFYDYKEKIRKITFHSFKNEKWGPVRIAGFHSKYGSDSPVFFGNNKIIFHSKRKIKDTSNEIIDDFWVVEKAEEKWTKPKRLGLNRFGKIHKMPMLSVAYNGNIYFNGTFAKGAYKLGIYVSKFKDNKYSKPVLLPEHINSEYLDWCPFISNDESYLIFSSNRHGNKNRGPDLYISFKDKEGKWLDPVNMGEKINSEKEERFGSVTMDGNIMLFMRGINEKAKYYWIDAKIINELKPKELKKTEISKKLNVNLKLAKDTLNEKDYNRAILYLKKSYEIAPDHPILNYQIARTKAFQSNREKAMFFLKKAVALGYGLKFPGEKWDISNDPAFKKYSNTDEFKSIVKAVNEVEKPVRNMTEVFKMKEIDLVPEGMTYDPVDDKFYFGSLKKNKIIRTDRAGKIENFTIENQDGLGSVLGMEVDSKNRILWACANINSRKAIKKKNQKNWAGVFKFDIITGRLIKKYIISFVKKRMHLFNDLVISENGDVYITDTGFSAIYKIPKKTDKLELFMKQEKFVSPNGITLSADEKTIYMSDWPVGIYSIDIETKNHFILTSKKSITTYGVDGLYLYKNSLIAVQNGMERISRFFLNKKGDQIIHLEVLESNNPILDVPTTGALNKNEFYFFANTPLYYFKPDNTLEIDKVKDLEIMKVKLKNR